MMFITLSRACFISFFLLSGSSSVWAQGDFKIVEGLVGIEEFFSNEGWGSEPLTNALEIPGEIVGLAFPPSDGELSLTGTLDGKPMSQRNHNTWEFFLTRLPENLENLKGCSAENVSIFTKLLKEVLEAELELKAKLNQEGISVQDVIHNSGLMVLKDYRKQGYALKLQQQALEFAKARGFKAIVVETTNIASAKVMARLGFQKFFEFPYKDFGINLDDVYTIWYIKL